jgi:hypothetical protein
VESRRDRARLDHAAVDACGAPREILTRDRIARISRVDCRVTNDNDAALHVLILPRNPKSA